MTDLGSKAIFILQSESVVEGEEFNPSAGRGKGPPRLMVESDAVDFILRGRNVFHGFVTACDAWLKAGEACLILDEDGTLIGHGTSQCDANEALRLKKGIAVRTRSDFSKSMK